METRIRAGMDTLWAATQEPDLHQRWDVRFGSIRYLTEAEAAGSEAVRGFRYATRIVPGLVIAGSGVSIGERIRSDGTCTSALRFWSPHPLSLIRTGSGWWRYVPQPDGTIRFLTGYDYEPGWGRLGPSADRAFRPLLGWATAWSFDRLRLWTDDGVDPRTALLAGLAWSGTRLTCAAAAIGVVRSLVRSPGCPHPVGAPPLLTTTRGSVLTGALAVAALRLPRPRSAPDAGRCLRVPPDALSRRTPSSMQRLTDQGADTGARERSTA